MQSSWQVSDAERNRVLRDAFRGRIISEQAVALYVFYLIILILARLIGGWFILVLGVVFILLCVAGVWLIWYRQLRGAINADYPIGSTATSSLADGRLRLVTAVSTTEIALDQLRKPRAIGSVVTFLLPGARLRRGAYPRVLLPDTVTSPDS